MPKKKKKSPVPRKSRSGLKRLAAMKKTHAAKLISQVNDLVAAHGFSASVHELHLIPRDGASLGCDDCLPPAVCRRVCFINDQGQPECEDRCVSPEDHA
jgi:hypothetical protein